MIEKRKIARMPADYEVYINYQGRTCAARARDVSNFGLGVFVGEQLGPGAPVELTMMLPAAGFNVTLKGEVCYCATNPDRSLRPYAQVAGIRFTEEVGADAPFLLPQGQVIHYAVSHTISIEAPAADCYRLMADFEHYPEWAKIMERVKVLEKFPDGRGKKVEFEVNIFLRKVRYVLNYSYDDQDFALSWVGAGGDVLTNTGRYRFQPLGDQTTSASFELDMSVDFPLPQRLINYLSRIAMRKSMKDFKGYVEKGRKA